MKPTEIINSIDICELQKFINDINLKKECIATVINKFIFAYDFKM